MSESSCGHLLSGAALNEALITDDRIFRRSTWLPSNVRGAGYDLRVATDVMVVPVRPGATAYRSYPAKKHRNEDVILAPGDTALFSTAERFTLAFDIAGSIGAKFSMAAKGLMILTGLSVDPGYGRYKNQHGTWELANDQRLHFLVANVGPEEVAIRPGSEKIAFVQFFAIPPIEDDLRQETSSTGFSSLSDLFSGDKESPDGLAYFKIARDAKIKVAELETEVHTLGARLNRVESSTDNVVVFGVFLVAATLLGVVIVAITQVVSQLTEDLHAWQTWFALILAGLFGMSILTVSAIAVGRLLRR